MKHQGHLYHGADAMHVRSFLSTGSSWFNSVMALMFANRNIAGVLYPGLRGGRNLTLRLMGRELIDWWAEPDTRDFGTRTRVM